MESKLIKYFEELAESQLAKSDVSFMPTSFNGRVYGIEARFSATKYSRRCKEDDFEKMKDVFLRRSGGTLRVASTWQEFCGGILSLRVAFRNHGYNEKKIMNVLRLFTAEILPSIRDNS